MSSTLGEPVRPRRAHLPSRLTMTTQSTLLPSLLDNNNNSKPVLISDLTRSTTSNTSTTTGSWRPTTPPSTSISSSLITPPSSPIPLSRPPLTSPQTWTPDFTLNLLFTSDGSSEEAPPSFYPSARIFFSPQLRIQSTKGIPYSNLGGLHLGVTGLVEILSSKGKVKSSRIFCDFTTDVSAGLTIWKRDAIRARRAAGEEGSNSDILPQGSYVLPLSMRIPRSDKLPPSFESLQFRISYTMSLALFSSATNSNGTPQRLKVFSIPFHVLPSTLPTPPPTIPRLTHATNRKGVFASIFQSLNSSKVEGFYTVIPSIPTSTYSAGGQIPVSLRITNESLEPTDFYVRVSLIRRIYVRESSNRSLKVAAEDEWGINGLTPNILGLPEEVLYERWNTEETEISSRWGFIPYSGKGEVIIKDLALPLSGVDGTWNSGYTSSLDLQPTSVPSLLHGESSWFSPAFRNRVPIEKEYSKHVHISSKFFVSIEIGFSTPECTLQETLTSIKSISPEIEIPLPNCFTSSQPPSISKYSGASLTNPFQPLPGSSRARRNHSLTPTSPISNSTTSPFNPAPPFPGKFREIFIPVEIGSVAEPSLDCIVDQSATSRAERAGREERGEDTRADEGEGAEGAWLLPPPSFEEACRQTPYLFSC